MPIRTVGNIRINHSTSRVVIDSSAGLCRYCLEELSDELRDILGFSVVFEAMPFSHFKLTIHRRLSTRKRGLVMDAVNDKIDYCVDYHSG